MIRINLLESSKGKNKRAGGSAAAMAHDGDGRHRFAQN